MSTAVDKTTYSPLNQTGANQSQAQNQVAHMDLPQEQQPQQAARIEKMKTLEIFQAMFRGKMPTNVQISDLLNSLLESPSVASRKHLMSSDGQKLLRDFQDLLRVLQQALTEKNKDELFQSLVYHLQTAPASMDKEHLKQINISGAVNKKEVKGGGNAILTIGRLILLNGEFRGLLNELVAIAQDIFGDAAHQAADSIQTTGESLSTKVRTMGDKVNQDEMDRSLDQVAGQQSSGSTQMAQESYDSGKMAQQGSSNFGTSEQDSSDFNGQQRMQMSAAQANANMNEYASKAQSYAKDKLDKHSSKAQAYAQDKFSPEMQQDVIQRLKRALHQIQQHPDYQQAIDTLTSLVSTWSGRISETSTSAKDAMANAAGVGQENNKGVTDWAVASQEAKAVLEDWAQGQSLNPIIQCLQTIATDVKNDESLRSYYDQVKDYMNRLLREPGYVDDDKSTEDGRSLLQHGKEVTKGRYEGHWNQLANETKTWSQYVANDPVAKEIRSCFERIHRDLWFDNDGNVAFKPNLLEDMRQTLLPAALEQIKVVPIPRIEYSDPTIDVVLENIILSGDALLPNIVEMKMDTYSLFSPKPSVGDIHKSSTKINPKDQQTVYIKMSETQAVIDNVVFCYQMRTFPRISDRGVASLHTGGKGITVTLKVTSDSADAQHAYTVRHCKCRIDDLKVKVHNSRHNLLYKTMHPMVVTIVRRQVAKAIEKKIVELLEQGDQRLTKYLYQNQLSTTSAVQQNNLTSNDSARLTSTTSPTQQRPGIFSSVVTMMNNSLKTSVAKRASRRLSSPAGKTATNANVEQRPAPSQQVVV